MKTQQESEVGEVKSDGSLGTIQEPFPLEDLGEWLLRARLAQKISQRQLAARIGVLPAALSRIERGRYRGVSFERLIRVMSALGVSLQVTPTLAPEENWHE